MHVTFKPCSFSRANGTYQEQYCAILLGNVDKKNLMSGGTCVILTEACFCNNNHPLLFQIVRFSVLLPQPSPFKVVALTLVILNCTSH
jgi:hypothetical protein